MRPASAPRPALSPRGKARKIGVPGRAPPRLVWGDDRAAHRFDQRAGDRQAKAGARLAPVGAPAAVEFLKDAFEFAWLHPRALVGNADHDLRALLAGMNDCASVAGIF